MQRIRPAATAVCSPAVMAILIMTSITGVRAETPETYYASDVPEQFDRITRRAEALGFGIGDSNNPDLCRHYQGLARSHGLGQPYFFVSKSGNKPEAVPACLQICDVDGVPVPCTSIGDSPGQLLVVRMGSRSETGERLRSNRIKRDKETSSSPPDALDVVVSVITFDGKDVWPSYGHPGGLQLVGDVLAVPLEAPYQGDPDNLVQFIDISDPENPQPLSTFEPGDGGSEFSAGLIGITPEPDGRYLMLLTGKKNKEVLIYRSVGTDLHDASLAWEFIDSWVATDNILVPTQDELDLGRRWPVGGGAHQMINFVREGGPNGQLYMIGGRDTNGGLPFGDDKFDLYRVEWQNGEFKPRYVATRHVEATPSSEDSPVFNDNLASFAAGVAAYVSPSGELIMYATEHDNDGPKVDGVNTVKAAEFRHIEIAPQGSSSYDPTVDAGGPYEVFEGDTINLSASVQPSATKAWAQLWADPNDDDRYIVIDYDDRFKDDFDDFKDLDDAEGNPFASGFSDQASSLRWFAPVGCTIQLNDNDIEGGKDPGDNILVLAGTGKPERQSNLKEIDFDDSNDEVDDELTSAQFETDCNTYYSAALTVAWDLDGNGSFETFGASKNFDAGELDGPDLLDLQVQAVHPVDGRSAAAASRIKILNVPPAIDSITAWDSAGNAIGSGVPFALVGLPLTLTASFSDPGRPDTQSATIDWNDGTVDPDTLFDVFSDASGGVTGQLEQQHIYDMAGTYSIRLDIVDDDDGRSDAALDINVASPIDALMAIVEELDLILVSTTSPDEYIAAILDARNNLAGNNSGAANNGAIDKLESAGPRAALTMIEAALKSLQRAEIAGSVDLNYMKNILGLTAEAIAQGVYLDAVAAIGTPSRGEARQLQRILQSITDGRALLLNGDFLAAIEMYQDAVGQAARGLSN